jgi:hypothetical protein
MRRSSNWQLSYFDDAARDQNLGFTVSTRNYYDLAAPKIATGRRAVVAFREWILAEVWKSTR